MVCTDRQGLFVTESLKRYSGAPTCESGLTLFRSAAQADLFYFAAIVRCDRSPRSADASVGRAAVVCCDRRSRALAAPRSFAAVGYGIAGRAPLSPFAPRGGSSFLRRFCEACPLFARLRQTSRGRFAAHHLSDGVLRRIPGKIMACRHFF